MDFKTILSTLPDITHLAEIRLYDGEQQVHHIPAIEGKLGSLRVYHALALAFNHQLSPQAAEKGIEFFAEHAEDAKLNPTKHPNIDLLFKVIAEQKTLTLELVEKK